MARRTGDRNRDFEAKRSHILAAVEQRIREPDAPGVTMHELAATAGVSVSTLRQHLGSRAQVLAAALVVQGERGAPYLAMVRAEPTEDAAASLRGVLAMMAMGLERGLGDVLATGMALGMRDRTVGPAVVNHLLEPILQSVEARLESHIRRGELPACNVRIAALSLVSPLVLGALHQGALCGNTVRPLAIEELINEVVSRFMTAYKP